MTFARGVLQYAVVTAMYWAFTLTDGALRMLVVLHFHQLGYQPLDVALLFVFYEFFGVVTNLLGGWLGARIGLNRTMHLGVALQLVALTALTVSPVLLTVPWVMAAQALSGIGKDLNKMSAKSSLKLLVPTGQDAQLYRWVARLTGSKNALKGVGFFLGALLLTALGFAGAVQALAAGLAVVWVVVLLTLERDLGKAKNKPKFRDILSKSRAINLLSAARLLLFASRDVWFVVALPVFLADTLGWDFWQVGGFLALWVIGYGAVQSVAPRLTQGRGPDAAIPDGRSAFKWALALAALPALIALGLGLGAPPLPLVVGGLLAFAVLFAINSALHSFLIVHYASADAVSLDVGFYYMANAAGRLAGTVLSGWLYQAHGLAACLWCATACVLGAAAVSVALPRQRVGAAPE